MGIGNDIKPKRVYRYAHSSKREVSLDSNKDDNEDYDEPEDHAEKIENLEDDFFHDYNKHKPHKKQESADDEAPEGGVLFQNLNAKNITWLLLIILAGIVIYQNKDSIWSMVHPKTIDQVVNENSNTDYYEGVNSNTNATAANSNTNTAAGNTNANTNTNSTAVSDLTTIKIEVLNGNGVSGSADASADILKTAGFTVTKVTNARKFTYETSIVYHKTGKEAEANLVKNALPNLSITLENSDNIVGTYDIVVVVGKT